MELREGNNAAKPVAGPQIETRGLDTMKLEKSKMASIPGNETNTIEKCPVKSLSQSTEKPLVALGQQQIKVSGGKGKK